jgi:hypothetical protein
VLDPAPVGEADPGVQAVAPRPDGVAGGPNTAAQRTESGAIGQSKAPDAATTPAPAPAGAATPPGIQPEAPAASVEPPAAPVLVAPPVAPPAVAAQDPSPAAEQPNSASAEPTPVAESTDDLAKWSVPLAVAGAALAGLALVYPAARRQQPMVGPAQAAVTNRPGERPATHPGGIYGPAGEPTLLTRSMRPVPNVRRNGSSVPYLRAVDSRHSTNVAGLHWSDPAADDRADRALA